MTYLKQPSKLHYSSKMSKSNSLKTLKMKMLHVNAGAGYQQDSKLSCEHTA